MESYDIRNRIRSMLHEAVPVIEFDSLTCSADGTDTTAVISGFNMEENYAKFAEAEWLTGNNTGAKVRIVHYDRPSTTLTFAQPLPRTTRMGDTCRIYTSLFFSDQEIVDAANYAALDVYNSLPKDRLSEVEIFASETVVLDANNRAILTLPADRSGDDLMFIVNGIATGWSPRRKVFYDTSCEIGVSFRNNLSAFLCVNTPGFTAGTSVNVRTNYIPKPPTLTLTNSVDWLDALLAAIITKSVQYLLIKRERPNLSTLTGALSRTSANKRE